MFTYRPYVLSVVLSFLCFQAPSVFSEEEPNLDLDCRAPIRSLTLRERKTMVMTIDLKYVNKAATQISGKGSGGLLRSAFLEAFVEWMTNITKYPRLQAQMIAYKEAQKKRLDLYYKLRADPDQKYPIENVAIEAVGSINRNDEKDPNDDAVEGPGGLTPDKESFSSEKKLDRTIDQFQKDFEDVRDRLEADLNIRQGILRWKVQKVLDLLLPELKDRALARLKARRLGLRPGETLKFEDFMVDKKFTDEALVEAALFTVGADLKQEAGGISPTFIKDEFAPLPWVSGHVDRILNTYIKKVDGATSAYYATSKGFGKVYTLSTGFTGFIKKLKTPLEAGVILWALLVSTSHQGQIVVQSIANGVSDLGTPTEVLDWRDNIQKQKDLKVRVADEAYTHKAFARNFGNWGQKETSDQFGRVATEFLTYYFATGKTDFKPANPDDEKYMAGAMYLIQENNILMWGKDNFGNPMITGANGRLKMREDTMKMWEEVSERVRDGRSTGPLPFADGAKALGPTKPIITKWSWWSVAKDKTADGIGDAFKYVIHRPAAIWGWVKKQF